MKRRFNLGKMLGVHAQLERGKIQFSKTQPVQVAVLVWIDFAAQFREKTVAGAAD